jgi:hypothetical protein
MDAASATGSGEKQMAKSRGRRGAPGIQGPIGRSGKAGRKGLRGDSGIKGATGPKGATGHKGERGTTGRGSSSFKHVALGAIHKQIESIYGALEIQMKRMAQVQVEIDDVRVKIQDLSKHGPLSHWPASRR